MKIPGMRGIGASAAIKVASLPVNALLTLISMQLIIGHWGVDAYASYGLLITLVALLPFADLGMAAVVINAVSTMEENRRDSLARTLLSVVRILLVSALGLVAVGTTITFAGLWPSILGPALYPSANAGQAVLTCITLFAANLPVSIGARALVGLGKNSTLVLTQTLQYPLILGALAFASMFAGFPPAFLPTFAYASTLLVNTICLTIAAKSIGTDLKWASRRVFRPGQKGLPIGHTAWPMLIQSVAVPIATQSDRIIISWVAGAQSLAEYNLAAQVFMMIWQVTAAAGIGLWPLFARTRKSGGWPPVSKSSLAFGGVTLVAGFLLLAAIPFVELYVAHNLISVPLILSLSFITFVTVNALLYPFGMLLTDPAGLRFQAVCVTLALPANIGISVALTPILGGAGPVLGSAISMVLFQLLPYMGYYYHHRRTFPNHDQTSESDA